MEKQMALEMSPMRSERYINNTVLRAQTGEPQSYIWIPKSTPYDFRRGC